MTAITRFLTATLMIAGLGFVLMTSMNSCATSASAEGQVEMNEALEHLRAARAALQRAEPNKGGHRESAIAFIDQAIHEVEAGKAYAIEHPRY